MADYLHKILNNPKGSIIYFDGSRGFENDDNEDEEKEEPIKDYEYQKQVLGQAFIQYERSYQLKYERRSLQVSISIDYLRMDFLVTFDNFNDFKTKDRFKKDFGLHAIQYYNFNKSVLFEIQDHQKFGLLVDLLKQYINSPARQSPDGQRYAIITIISGFEFLSREALLKSGGGYSDDNNSVVLELTRKADSELEKQKATLENAMIAYIEDIRIDLPDLELQVEEKFLTFNGLAKDLLFTLIDNFDIIASIQAIRIPKIHTTIGGLRFRSYDFDIDLVNEKAPLIAIIDTGVNKITPLTKIIADFGYTFDTIYPPYQTTGWHGTAVAVIAACGEAFFKSNNRNLKSSCKIVSYRVFEDEEGKIDFVQFESVIRDCRKKGVRFFNLSMNVGFKPYNSDYSYFSYLLDKLSYELDILIFISAGNLDGADLANIYTTMQLGPYPNMMDYPKHYFFPETYCNEHSCEGTNLKIPGESLNNITVGALAENLEPRSTTDMTLDKTLPAYYTSKYHVSAYHKVNGSRLKQKHINYRLVKPDIVYPGGDYGNEDAGIQLTGSGLGNDFFRMDCGTSFATPFAINLASKIALQYSALNAQSVKALIINSAKPMSNSFFLTEHCKHLKESFSHSEFGKDYSALDRSEKLKVNKWFHEEDLLSKLVGYGMPDAERALSSNRKSITVIIEDKIALDSHKAIPINLPKYLNQFSKKSPIVNVQATLCFKFQPNFKDQTGYNPLHMSFNFIKSYDRPEETAKIAAYRDGLDFYTRLYHGENDSKQKTKLRNTELGVKTKVETWSDDFYPNGRQFSNCQKLSLQINTKDLAKVENSISLIVRCTGKTLTDFDTQSYLSGKHPYSLVLTFSEKNNTELNRYDFYKEFSEINQTLDIVIQVDLDTTLEAEG